MLIAPPLRSAAQPPPQVAGAPPLQLIVYTLQHQPASGAIELLHPLLSERGTIELQPGGNTVVIRDEAGALERMLPLLREYDHPPRALRLEIQIVRAGTDAGRAGAQPALPEPLARRLRGLLRYQSFALLAGGVLEAREGEEVVQRLGESFSVSFRLGTLLADRRLKLAGFRLERADDNPQPRPLIHTNLNLWLEEPMVLGLARTEASREALMVVVTGNLAEEKP